MHDNGCTPHQPDLAKLIDYAGAVVVACETLETLARHAAADLEGTPPRTCLKLLTIAAGLDEAHWYLACALRDLRSLV